MGLFAALTSQATETVNSSKKTGGGGGSSDIPTIVQLYSGGSTSSSSSMVQFEQSTASVPTYAVLSYAAVPVTTAYPGGEGGGGENQSPETPLGAAGSTRGANFAKGKPSAIVPELGVWNCRCVPTSTAEAVTGAKGKPSLQDGPLLQIPKTPSTFCLAVELSKPNQVEPTIAMLQGTLVRHLIARPEPTPEEQLQQQAAEAGAPDKPEAPVAATSLYDLRSVQFGLAPNDEASAAKMSGEAPDEGDRKVKIALVICAIRRRPASSSGADEAGADEDYREKQAQALIAYHLRRYAAALNAYLCFVDANPGTAQQTSLADEKSQDRAADPAIGAAASGAADKEHQQQPAVSTWQLGMLFWQLAQGKQLDLKALTPSEMKGTTAAAAASPEAGEGETAAASAEANPLVYGPFNAAEQDELIETALQRNAHYPGQWDASKDSLWKVLPSDDGSAGGADDAGKGPNGKKKEAGDGGWLQELLDSVGGGVAGAKSPPRKTPSKKGVQTPAAKSTPGGADVTDFFSSLLKPDKK